MATPTTWQRALLAAGAEVGPERLTEIAVEAMEEGLPVLREDADLRDAARSSATANVALVVEIVQGAVPLSTRPLPPQAAAFARELARRNVPVADLGRAYRLAQHALWRWAVDTVRARLDDEAAVSAAVEDVSEAAFATGDVFNTVAMEHYAEERERWLRSADAVRAALVRDLLAGVAVDADTASARLRYELRRAHQAFVVWADTEGAIPETAAAAIGGDRALLVPMGVGVVAGWAPPASVDPERAAGASVALGTEGHGLGGFRQGHREAMEARRVARLLRTTGAPVRYADVALVALLTKDLDEARTFAQRILGPLAADDETTRRLADTLLAVLEEQNSPRRAGHRLGVHENTVAKRLRAIEQLGGPSAATSGGATGELIAALLIHRATAPASP